MFVGCNFCPYRAYVANIVRALLQLSNKSKRIAFPGMNSGCVSSKYRPPLCWDSLRNLSKMLNIGATSVYRSFVASWYGIQYEEGWKRGNWGGDWLRGYKYFQHLLIRNKFNLISLCIILTTFWLIYYYCRDSLNSVPVTHSCTGYHLVAPI